MAEVLSQNQIDMLLAAINKKQRELAGNEIPEV